MEEKPNYYAVIPADIRYDKELKDKAKLLYGEIVALSNKEGYCWATNNYFAELYGVSKMTISRLIQELAKRKYIDIEMKYKEDSKEIVNRYIKISIYPIYKNIDTPIYKKLKDNNTSINNTSINNKHIYGEYKHVKLTDSELEKLKSEYSNYYDLITYLDEYIEMKGYKAKNHYLCIKKWVVNAVKEHSYKSNNNPEWIDKNIERDEMTDEECEKLRKELNL